MTVRATARTHGNNACRITLYRTDAKPDPLAEALRAIVAVCEARDGECPRKAALRLAREALGGTTC